MKTKLADTTVKIWRPQHAQTIELVHGTFTTYSTPLHFHENLEINIKHGNAWEFYYRRTTIHKTTTATCACCECDLRSSFTRFAIAIIVAGSVLTVCAVI